MASDPVATSPDPVSVGVPDDKPGYVDVEGVTASDLLAGAKSAPSMTRKTIGWMSTGKLAVLSTVLPPPSVAHTFVSQELGTRWGTEKADRNVGGAHTCDEWIRLHAAAHGRATAATGRPPLPPADAGPAETSGDGRGHPKRVGNKTRAQMRAQLNQTGAVELERKRALHARACRSDDLRGNIVDAILDRIFGPDIPAGSPPTQPVDRVELAVAPTNATLADNPFVAARNRDAYESVPLARVFDAHALASRIDGPAYAAVLNVVELAGVRTLGQLEDDLAGGQAIGDVFHLVPAAAVDEVAAAVRAWFRRPADEAVAGGSLTTAELEDAYLPVVFPRDNTPTDLQQVHDCRFGLPVPVAGLPLPHAVIAAAHYIDVVVYTLQPVRPVMPPTYAIAWGRRRSEPAHAGGLPESVPLDGVRCMDRRGREYAFGPDSERIEVTRPRTEVIDYRARLQAEDDIAATQRAAKQAPAKAPKRKGRAA